MMKAQIRRERNNQGDDTLSHLMMAKRAVCASLMILALVCGLALTASAQTLADFGYNRIRVNGKEAKGERPLLVILAEYEGSEAFVYDPDSYDSMIFKEYYDFSVNLDGTPTPKPSLRGYFREISQDRFTWTRAGQGVIGPLSIPSPTSIEPGDSDDIKLMKRLAMVKEAAVSAGFDFAQFDTNADGAVSIDELTVLVIENYPGLGGVNRQTIPGCVQPDGSPVALCMSMAAVGHRGSLMVMAHELTHTLGVPYELYSSNNYNYGYTTMGSSPGVPDDMSTFHLDPFCKMQLGWIEPRIHSLLTPGTATLPAQQMGAPDAPVILYNPNKGTNEYYILEYRTSTRRCSRAGRGRG